MKRTVLGSFTLAAAINRFRRTQNHPQAEQVIQLFVKDLARHFPDEERKDFLERCTRSLNE